jgi:hypothetical protein
VSENPGSTSLDNISRQIGEDPVAVFVGRHVPRLVRNAHDVLDLYTLSVLHSLVVVVGLGFDVFGDVHLGVIITLRAVPAQLICGERLVGWERAVVLDCFMLGLGAHLNRISLVHQLTD